VEEVNSEICVITLYRLRDVLDGGNMKWDSNPKHRQYNSLIFSICKEYGTQSQTVIYKMSNPMHKKYTENLF
jgi:hypothetical protein